MNSRKKPQATKNPAPTAPKPETVLANAIHEISAPLVYDQDRVVRALAGYVQVNLAN